MQVKNLKISLLITRISVVLFMIPWVILKFSNPQYTSDIIGYFYGFKIPEWAPTAIGVFWVVLLTSFMAGFQKRFSYGLVLLLHAISTLSTYKILLNPFSTGDQKDVLFMAALPALGAILLLYVLRSEDSLLSLNK